MRPVLDTRRFTTGLWRVPDVRWVNRYLDFVVLKQKGRTFRFLFHREAMGALYEAWAFTGTKCSPYEVRCIHGYAPRVKYIDGKAGAGLSKHAYGLAIDINPLTNQPGTKGDIPRDWVAAFEVHGFGWGGNWRQIKDPMHFQFKGKVSK